MTDKTWQKKYFHAKLLNMKVNTNSKEVVNDRGGGIATNRDCVFESKKTAKKLVEIVGVGLGNLIWRIHKGNFKIEGCSDKDIKQHKKTKYFILGGSIGTNGYTKVLLPILAQNQIKKLAKGNLGVPEILSTDLNSAIAGALGTFHAFTKGAKEKIYNESKEIYKENKIPILAMVDIGGTKISFILTCLGQDGQPNNKILQNYSFPTRKCDTPEEFYQQLVLYIRPILDNFENGVYCILPMLSIGQPGRITKPKGIVEDGGDDLGTSEGVFLNCNPSSICQNILKNVGHGMDVYVCNDGIAQFNGALMEIKINNPVLWKKMCEEEQTNVMYLGIGTGLGSGHAIINKDGSYEIGNFRDAYKIRAIDDWEKIDYSLEGFSRYAKLLRLPSDIDYKYGDLISGKFFRKYMHFVEYNNVQNNKSLAFIPYTGLANIPEDSLMSFLRDVKNINSPLDTIIINKILEKEVVSSKAEQAVDSNKEEIIDNLKKILETYSDEISGTLVDNIKKSHYGEVVSKVVRTKKIGGSVFFVGIGKSHSIAYNLSERYRNLGIHSACLELTGANSENLTNLKEGDLIFMLSNSGKSWELLNLIDYIRRKGCCSVAITGDLNSRLALGCDYLICSKVKDVTDEIVRLPEAPTTTTTAALAVGTAIGVLVCHYFDYNKDQFYLDHPNLIYDKKIKFEGASIDSNFSINVKAGDIFKRLSKNISNLNKESFHGQVIPILKKILISYYNKRTVFITGSGSSLRVAEKMAATLTSIGIDATAVNPAQLPHGDFAHIVEGDLLIIISFSGETSHLKYICDLAKSKGIDIALITGNENSTLAKEVFPYYIIADSEMDDEKLVPIPDQKLFSSFLNLAIGDAISVLLAWLIKTTHYQFATLGHRGGAIARMDSSYQKYLSAVNNFDVSALKININKEWEMNDANRHFVNLLIKDIKNINNGELPEEYTNEKLAKIINSELSVYSNRIQKKKQDVMIFGMGAIGLAYLGQILSASKRSMIFVESDNNKILFFQDKKDVILSSGKGSRIVIPIKGIISSLDIDKISTTALNVDTVFVAVRLSNISQLIDTILFIVLRRYAYDIQDAINFVFDENFQVYDKTLESLRYEIYRKIDNPDIKSYFDEFVGLVPSINEAIISEIKVDSSDPIKVEEYIPPLYVDETKWKKRKGVGFPELSDKIKFENNFVAIHMRKLWVHNMAHSLTGYLGHALRYKTIPDAISDKRIEEKVKSAMKSIGYALYSRWDYSETEHKTIESYIEWCIKKYKNKFMADTVDRICRDPERKLRENDRLIGPLNYIWQYDRAVAKDILLGIIAAAKYNPKKYKQTIVNVLGMIKIDPKELSLAVDDYEEFVGKK